MGWLSRIYVLDLDEEMLVKSYALLVRTNREVARKFKRDLEEAVVITTIKPSQNKTRRETARA